MLSAEVLTEYVICAYRFQYTYAYRLKLWGCKMWKNSILENDRPVVNRSCWELLRDKERRAN